MYGDDDLARLADKVGRRLVRAHLTVAVAESCSGGWISKAITDISGSSRWFMEGFVTYSNESKHQRLGVPELVLRKHGAVSEAAARAMAAGAVRRAGSTLSVAVTGIAGPDGGVPGKPVGTVWLAWARRRGRTISVIALRRHFRGDRETVRRKTVREALLGLIR